MNMTLSVSKIRASECIKETCKEPEKEMESNTVRVEGLDSLPSKSGRASDGKIVNMFLSLRRHIYRVC